MYVSITIKNDKNNKLCIYITKKTLSFHKNTTSYRFLKHLAIRIFYGHMQMYANMLLGNYHNMALRLN